MDETSSASFSAEQNRASLFVSGAFLVVACLLVATTAGCGATWLGAPDEHTVERPTRESGPATGMRDGGDRESAPEGAVAETALDAGHWAYGDVPLLRVGLAKGVENATISARGTFSVAVYADRSEVWESRAGQRWEFRADLTGVTGRGPGSFFRIDAGTIRVRPGISSLLVFDGVAYRGEIELFSSGPGSLTVVNIIDLESYLRGVVPKEIGPRSEAELEAVKAQAVAARTYAVSASGRRAQGDFDVYGTVDDQVYAGADVEDPVSDEAIRATAGLFLSYMGEPVSAYFHANCGGRTEARHEVWGLERVPYLTQVWDTPSGDRFDDAFCSTGAHFTWEESWSGKELGELVERYLPTVASTPVTKPVGTLKNIRVSDRTPSGRIRWLEVETSSGRYRVFGDKVRWLLRRPDSGRILWSSWFELDVDRRGGSVSAATAEGRGYGHGVGMCQHGALEMAREGYSFDEILRHYYPGTELARSYESSSYTP